MTTRWTVDDIPDQQGRIAVITGASSGIGYEAAKVLAGKGARVILAVRDEGKGQTAAKLIRDEYPSALLEVMILDLADLASIRRFADAFQQRYAVLQLLINNAGVMAIPFRRTADGFERQFGTNHLGHFALTGLLLQPLLAASGARVVTVSSLNHNFGSIDFDNFNGEKRYGRWGAYNQSKLANLLFAYELQRRFDSAGLNAISVGCHPGFAATNLQIAGPKMDGSRLGELIWRLFNRFGQTAEMGAMPTLFAATAPDVRGGDFIGPTAFGGTRGLPSRVRSSGRSYDEVAARRLWQVSTDLTGVAYVFPGLAKGLANEGLME